MGSNLKDKLFFIAAFIAVCFYFSYPLLYHYPPQSTHVWRQTDCTSIALNYYYNDLDFLRPQILNVCDKEGYTVSEFPILYYLTATLYKVFGVQEGILRLWSLVFVFAGFFALSRLSMALVKDRFIAICFPLIIFSSPLLAFYSFNFLPDAAALGLVFCSWYFFYAFMQKSNKRSFVIFILLSLFAGLLKVTALLSLIALLVIWLIERIKLLSFPKPSIPLAFPKFRLGMMLAVLLLVVAWLAWAKQYNAANSAYFFAGILPVWSLVPESQQLILEKLLTKWSWVYLHPVLHLLVGISFSYFLVKAKKQNPIMWWGMVLLFLANIAVYLLWFKQFNHHDYYAISLFVFPVLVLLNLFLHLRKHQPQLIKHWAFRLGLIAFTCFHIFYAKQELIFRYKPDSNYKAGINPSFYKTQALQAWLQKNQVSYKDKVLSLPDVSPNISLYYYHLRGWTNYNVKESWVPFAGRRNYTEKSIRHLIQQGCKYLLINKKEYLNQPELKTFLAYPIDDFEGSLFLYDLSKYSQASEETTVQ